MSEHQNGTFDVEYSSADYFRSNVNCQSACPVGTDAGGYVRAIAEGDYELAYLIARGPNPLASICGRVCGAPCEKACRRCEIDQAVSIRALKRFVTERHGVESHTRSPRALLERLFASSVNRGRRGKEDIVSVAGARGLAGASPEGEKVAIIGSGPAGLAAAHDLALMGMRPVVFEMEPVAAGMLALGIPEYRLPRDLIRSEIDVIRELGVEIRCNTRVGVDVTLPELRREFRATLIGIGAKRARALRIPGSEGRGVLGGVDFLRAVALNEPLPLGRRVVVIGGGNVAFDVSRTVIRQAGYDVSRLALRAPSVQEVHLCCLESLEEMPADDVEILEGHEEGVQLRPRLGPKEILLDEQGQVRGIVFQRVLSVFDEQRRFAPRFADEYVTIEADTILWSIGQQSDLSFIDAERDGIQVTERGTIQVDPVTLQTTAPDVFVIGDAAHGLKLMIDAVASGKKAARSVQRFLRGREPVAALEHAHTVLPGYSREKDYETTERTELSAADVSERTRAQNLQVEYALSEERARVEASRCLDCGVNTIFDSTRCVLCGGCVDVCPEDCLQIVSLDRISAESGLSGDLEALRGERELSGCSAIIKDETACIRCAECVRRCPVGAVSMERFSFIEEWHEQ